MKYLTTYWLVFSPSFSQTFQIPPEHHTLNTDKKETTVHTTTPFVVPQDTTTLTYSSSSTFTITSDDENIDDKVSDGIMPENVHRKCKAKR